jgi:hypothetical protein
MDEISEPNAPARESPELEHDIFLEPLGEGNPNKFRVDRIFDFFPLVGEAEDEDEEVMPIADLAVLLSVF